jgi:hypothetical protein
LPETTKVLFFLVCAVVAILLVGLAPYDWVVRRWVTGLFPERITNTRWFRGAAKGVVIALLLVMAYGGIFWVGTATKKPSGEPLERIESQPLATIPRHECDQRVAHGQQKSRS